MAWLVSAGCCAASFGAIGGVTTTTPPGPDTTIGATTTTTTTGPSQSSDPPVGTPVATHDTDVVRSEADAAEPLCRLDARPPGDLDPVQDAAAADALLPAMSVVNTYGVPLGQEFRGSGQSWNGDGERVVVASFVANVADHRAALTDLVDEPDRLVVCRARLTVGESNEIMAAVAPLIAGSATSGQGGLVGQVTVAVHAGNEPLAEQLHAAYGDQIEVTLGVFPYPMPDPLPEAQCPALVGVNADLVTASDGRSTISVEASAGFETLVPVPFANVTSDRVDFMTGYPAPYLVEGDTGRVVGVADANTGIPAVGLLVDLAPGAEFDAGTWVPTASCDPALGHTVPPGDYELFAVYHAGNDVVGTAAGEFAVGPVPVTVTVTVAEGE